MHRRFRISPSFASSRLRRACSLLPLGPSEVPRRFRSKLLHIPMVLFLSLVHKIIGSTSSGEPQQWRRRLAPVPANRPAESPWGVSGPSDRDPVAQNRSYPFGVTFAKESLHFLIIKPAVPWRVIRFALFNSENVFWIGLGENTLSSIYNVAIRFKLLIICPF